MPDTTSILITLLKALFTGFGFTIPIICLIKVSGLEALEFKNQFILTAVKAIRVAGILYLLLFVAQTFEIYSEAQAFDTYIDVKADTIVSNASYDRLFGPYWLVYWFSALMCLVLTQALWFKKLYIKKAALIVMALLLLILPSQRFLMFITSLHRDYLPSSWAIYFINPFIELALDVVVFVFVTLAIVLIGRAKGRKI